MEVTLSQGERDTILNWYDEVVSRGVKEVGSNVAFPDEVSLVSLMKNHKGGPIELSLSKLTIILSWAEDVLDCNFGQGSITSYEEQEVLKKIQKSYNLLCEINDLPSSKQLVDVKDEDTSFGRITMDSEPPKTGWWIFGGVMISCVVAVIIVMVFKLNRTINAAKGTPYNIEFIVGEVYKKREAGWKQIYKSDRLFSGDSIMTRKSSYIIISNKRGSRRLEENRVLLLR
jgi:hypothetical protein